MKSQFEKLEKRENLEVLRDLLYEMFDLVLDKYAEVVNNIDHQACEALAAFFHIEYKLYYFDLLSIISSFLMKSIPHVNKELELSPFLCYSTGNCTGVMEKHSNYSIHATEKVILIVYDPSQYIELEDNVVGIIANSVHSIYTPLLLSARAKGLPVSIGFYPSIKEECNFYVDENACSLNKFNVTNNLTENTN